MFHCNGWCIPLGGHGCRRHARVPARGRRARRDLAADRGGGRHPPQRRADRARRDRQRIRGRSRSTAPLMVTTAGAPPTPDAASAQWRSSASDRPRLRPDRDLRAVHGLRAGSRVGRAAAEERARLMARQGVGHAPAPTVRVVDRRDGDDVPARRRDARRGRHARQQRHEGLPRRRPRRPSRGLHAAAGSTPATSRSWHPDGYIELRDRAKDIIISGGENISTVEVEQALDAHPAVLEVAVVGVPDEKWGERPKAFVVLARRAAGRPSPSSSRTPHARIARYKAPERDRVRRSLPKTSTGKILKYELRRNEAARSVSREDA